MTEISYIIQNGQQVNLKDANGRALLAEKQNKLKAGKGIEITADGTILVKEAKGSDFKDLIIENIQVTTSDGDYTYTIGSMQIKYKGNLSLLRDVVDSSESSGMFYLLSSILDDSYVREPLNGYASLYDSENPLGKVVRTAIDKLFADGNVEDTGEDYLYFVPITIHDINPVGNGRLPSSEYHIDETSCNMIIALKDSGNGVDIANDEEHRDSSIPADYDSHRLVGAYIASKGEYRDLHEFYSNSYGTDGRDGIFTELMALL
jgi:hypothetical protein